MEANRKLPANTRAHVGSRAIGLVKDRVGEPGIPGESKTPTSVLIDRSWGGVDPPGLGIENQICPGLKFALGNRFLVGTATTLIRAHHAPVDEEMGAWGYGVCRE